MKLKLVVVDLELTRRQKRLGALGLAVGTALITSVALAAPMTFEANAPLKATELNAAFGDLHDRLAMAEQTLIDGVAEADHALTADAAMTASGAAPGAFGVPGTLQVTGNATVGGVLSVGLRQSTSCTFVAAAGYSDCACAANERAISGGGYSQVGYIDESNNSSGSAMIGTTWRVACKNAAGTRIPCNATYAVCARLAP